MSKTSKQFKNECLDILQSANVTITKSQDTEYYFVLRTVYNVSQDNIHKFEMNIVPGKFGISRYTITKANGEKFSCHARPDAVFFHRPVADDILEVYQAIKLRHLIQQSNIKQKTRD